MMSRGEVVVDACRVAARATQGVALQVQRLGAVDFGDRRDGIGAISALRKPTEGGVPSISSLPPCLKIPRIQQSPRVR